MGMVSFLSCFCFCFCFCFLFFVLFVGEMVVLLFGFVVVG